MKGELKSPTSLLEAITFFSDEKRAFQAVVERRWPNGVTCPLCGSANVRFMESRRFWNCNGCKKQFSAKTCSIFQGSPLPFSKWLPAMWLIANCRNGVSSCEIHRALGITQKSAWFMLHRIRAAMQNGSLEMLSGEVEVDESYFGGRSRNQHSTGVKRGRGAWGKTPVVGAVERGGKVVTQLTQFVGHQALTPFVAATVKQDAKVYTDEWAGYNKLSGLGFDHQTINHNTGLYVKGDIHTQNIESFWSLIKRTLVGTYVSVEPIHLHRYLAEYGFRFDVRKRTEAQRFTAVLSQVAGKRLTFAQLIGKESGYRA
jgi:transposase-like protein